MDFQVVLASPKFKLWKTRSESVRSAGGEEPISVTNLAAPNSSFRVPIAIRRKLNDMIQTKFLKSLDSRSETCSLELSIHDRRTTVNDNSADTGYFWLSDLLKNGIIDMFASVAGGADNVKISLSFQLREFNKKIFEMNSRNLEIKRRHGACYVDFNFSFPSKLLPERWNSRFVQCNAKLKLYVRFNEQAVINIHMKGSESDRSLNILKGLWIDAQRSGDVCIEAGDQQIFCCHRAVLTASTDYFKTMFQSGMQEETTSAIKMPDMNGETVEALLAYLYLNDISTPLKCCATAYQLLVAADKYEIPLLYDSMAEFFLHRSNDWCSVETALQLHFFAKNKIAGRDSMENWLQKKALDVLRSKGRDVLDKCPVFQQAFVVEGQPGKQLCMDLLLMEKEAEDVSSESEAGEDHTNSDDRNGADGNHSGGENEDDLHHVIARIHNRALGVNII